MLRFKHRKPMSDLAREYGITHWSVRSYINHCRLRLDGRIATVVRRRFAHETIP